MSSSKDITDFFDLACAINTFANEIDAAGELAGVVEIRTEGGIHYFTAEIAFDPEQHSCMAIDKRNRENRERCGFSYKCGQEGCPKCDGIPF